MVAYNLLLLLCLSVCLDGCVKKIGMGMGGMGMGGFGGSPYGGYGYGMYGGMYPGMGMGYGGYGMLHLFFVTQSRERDRSLNTM
jgi:hypothetical protein